MFNHPSSTVSHVHKTVRKHDLDKTRKSFDMRKEIRHLLLPHIATWSRRAVDLTIHAQIQDCNMWSNFREVRDSFHGKEDLLTQGQLALLPYCGNEKRRESALKNEDQQNFEAIEVCSMLDVCSVISFILGSSVSNMLVCC